MTLEEYRNSFWGDVGGSLKQSPAVALDVGQIATGGIARFADRMTGGAFPALGNYGQQALQKRGEYEDLVTQSPDISPNVSGMFSAGMDVGKAATEQLAMSGVANLAGRAIQGIGAARGAATAGRGLSVADKAHQVALQKLQLARASGDPAKIKAATDAAKTAWQARGAAAGTAKAITATPGQAFRAGASVAPQFGTRATLLGGAARMVPPAVDAFGVDGGEYAQRIAAVGGGTIDQPAQGPLTARAEAETAPGMAPAMPTQADAVTAPRGTGVFTNNEEWTPERLTQAFDAPLKPGEIRIGQFRGSQEDARAILEDYQKQREMAGRRQATMGYQSQDQRDGIDRNTMSAIQIGDKREMDRRMASINAMPEGPEKQDALASLRDEETAKRQSGLKDSDKHEGLKGSPDWNARQGRMAAYEQKLKELSNQRLISKREANIMLREENEKEERAQKVQVEMAGLQTKLELANSAKLAGKVDELQGKIVDLNTQSAAWNKEENARLGLDDGWDKEFIKIRNGLQTKHQKDAKYTKALNEMPVESRQEFMRVYTAMSKIGDKNAALSAALVAVMLPEPKE